MKRKRRNLLDFIPDSFKPHKCPTCGQSIRKGERRSKWGFTGVVYNKRDKCFHGTVRVAPHRYVTRCAFTPSHAARLRNQLIRKLISENKIAKAANGRWRNKRGRELSRI